MARRDPLRNPLLEGFNQVIGLPANFHETAAAAVVNQGRPTATTPRGQVVDLRALAQANAARAAAVRQQQAQVRNAALTQLTGQLQQRNQQNQQNLMDSLGLKPVDTAKPRGPKPIDNQEAIARARLLIGTGIEDSFAGKKPGEGGLKTETQVLGEMSRRGLDVSSLIREEYTKTPGYKRDEQAQGMALDDAKKQGLSQQQIDQVQQDFERRKEGFYQQYAKNLLGEIGSGRLESLRPEKQMEVAQRRAFQATPSPGNDVLNAVSQEAEGLEQQRKDTVEQNNQKAQQDSFLYQFSKNPLKAVVPGAWGLGENVGDIIRSFGDQRKVEEFLGQAEQLEKAAASLEKGQSPEDPLGVYKGKSPKQLRNEAAQKRAGAASYAKSSQELPSAKQALGNLGMASLEVVLPGRSKAITAPLKAGAKQAPNLAKAVGKQAGIVGAFGAGYGGAEAYGRGQPGQGNLVQQLTQNIDAKDVAKTAGVYGLMGGALGGAIPVAGRAINPLSKLASPTARKLAEAAESVRSRYQDSPLVRRIEEKVNPTAPLARIDRAEAKRRGIKPEDLPAEERAEHLYDVVKNSDTQTDALLRKTKIDKITTKYGDDTEVGKEYNAYLNARKGVEVEEKTGAKIVVDKDGNAVSKKDLQAFIRSYEKKNKSAKKESARFKAARDKQIDDAAKAGIIDKEGAKFVKAFYSDYVPTPRATPEALQRGGGAAKPVGTLGKQDIISQIKGSKIALDDTFASKRNTYARTQEQINRGKLFNLIEQRVANGSAKGEVLLSKQQSGRLRELGEIITSLAKDKRSLKADASWARQNRKAAKGGVKNYERQAVTRAKAILRQQLDDAGSKAAVGSLSKDDLLFLFRDMAAAGEQNTKRTMTGLTKNRGRLKDLDKLLKQTRDDFSQLSDESRQAFGERVELRMESTTGKQVISGTQDGLPVKIEVSPELARVLGGIGEESLPLVLRGMRQAFRPFRMFWTGAAAPIFSLVSFGFYDAPMMLINSRYGVRSLFGPKGIRDAVTSISRNAEFQGKLDTHGAMRLSGSQIEISGLSPTEYLSAKRNAATYAKYAANPKNWGKLADRLDLIGGKFATARRTQVARAHYDVSIKKGMTEDAAMAEAVYAFNNVLPNYRRASSLMRQLDAVIPYASASVAGTRSFLTAMRRRPVKTTAKVAGAFVMPAIGATTYNMSSAEGRAFYQDMIDSGKDYTLDNNIAVVLPGASRKEDGSWDGVLKIPVPPEFRGLHKAIWRQSRDAISGEGLTNPMVYAGALFDTLTGQITPLAIRNGSIAANPSSVSPPAMIASALSTNVDPRTGKEIVPEDLKDLPSDKQVFGKTSQLARIIGGALGASPIKIDYVLRQFGTSGRSVQSGIEGILAGSGIIPQERVAKSDFKEDLKNRFSGAYGESDQSKFFTGLGKIRSGLSDKQDRELLDAFFAKNQNKTDLDGSGKANYLLGSLTGDKKLYEAMLQSNDLAQRIEGKSDPLLNRNEPEKQRTEQLVYEAMGLARATGQQYTRGEGSKSSWDQLGLSKPESKAFQERRNAFFESLPPSGGGVTGPSVVKPAMDPNLQAFADAFQGMPKGTGARSNSLKTGTGQQYLDFFKKSDAFTNLQRNKFGLSPLPSEQEGSGFGGKSSGGSGGGPGGRKRSGGRKTGGRKSSSKGKKLTIKKLKKPKKASIKKYKLKPFKLPKPKKYKKIKIAGLTF